MKLEDLIVTYVHNPSEDLKNIIDSKVKTMSSIKIFSALSKIKEEAEHDETNRNQYYEIISEVLEALKKNDATNYVVNENNRLSPVQKK